MIYLAFTVLMLRSIWRNPLLVLNLDRLALTSGSASMASTPDLLDIYRAIV